MDLIAIALTLASLMAGGVIKGAVGAGAPLIAVPLLSLLYDVPTAVAIFTLPSLLSNLWQGWQYRKSRLPRRFVWLFAFFGAAGAGVGSVMLANLPGDSVLAAVACLVFVYIGIRVMFPTWSLERKKGFRLAAPMGFAGGILQGVCGISAPVSLTYLNAMRLSRTEFIGTVATFFTAMSFAQVIALWGVGILTPNLMMFSLLATIPLFSAMPLGVRLARRVSKDKFDKVILILLAAIACRLLYGAFAA